MGEPGDDDCGLAGRDLQGQRQLLPGGHLGHRRQASGGWRRHSARTPTAPRRCGEHLVVPRGHLRPDDDPLYVNGTQVVEPGRDRNDRQLDQPALRSAATRSTASTSSGLIDDVRVYNTALTAGPDPDRHDHPGRHRRRPTRTPPSAPGALSATAISGSVSISAGARHRQRRGHRLPDRALPGRRLHQLRPDRSHRRHQHQLQRHHRHRRHQLQLPRPRQRRRRQPRPLLQHRHRNNTQPGHNAAVGAGRVERDRDQRQSCRSQLGYGQRQRRCHRLPRRALPGRRLQQLRPDRHHRRHHHQLQRHQRHRRHQLQLPRPRQRRRRQPRPLHQHRHRNNTQPGHNAAVGAGQR